MTITEKKAHDNQLRDLISTSEIYLRDMYAQMDPKRIEEASYGKSPTKKAILEHVEKEIRTSNKDISRLKDIIQEIEENYDISLPKKAKGLFTPTPQFATFEKDLVSLLVNKIVSDQATKDKLLKLAPQQLIMHYTNEKTRQTAIQKLLDSEKYYKLDLTIFKDSYLIRDILELQQSQKGPKL